MKRGYKGSITIYLAMIFSVMISLIFTLVQDIRSQAARLSLECAVDLSLYSVFAEYHKELLEQYDLFFIDSGYESVSNIDNVGQHLKGYMDDNFTFGMQQKGNLLCDFLQMETEQVKICGYTRATDEEGEVFKRQAIAYMKDATGLSYLENWQEKMNVVEDNQLLTRDITAERNAIQQEIDSIEIPLKKISEDEYEEVPLDNPADRVNASRNAGILHLVVKDVSSLSQEGVNLPNCASHRDLNKGYGLLDREKTSAVEDLLYHEYILSKCGNYTNQMEKSKLKYQVEYILAGKDNDVENLKWVVNRLLLLREVANVTYIYTDSVKVMEAKALALSLAAATLNPMLIEPVKHSILFAWAYAESVYDVKQLLAGKRVPLLKTKQSWHYSLTGMLNYEGGLDDSTNDMSGKNGLDDLSGDMFSKDGLDDLSGDMFSKDGLDDLSKDMFSKDGLNDLPDDMFSKEGLEDIKEKNGIGLELGYKDYLRILLMTVSEKDSVFRMMDVVEMDIRKTTENNSFVMDGCVDYIDVKVYGSSGFGTTMEIRRSYFYF